MAITPSSPGIRPSWEIYRPLLKLKLIYGGGSTGLMGLIADTALAEGVDVMGIIPELLTEWEHHHKGLTQLAIVADMHTRKKMMYERCDAAIILPGGFGTLDEFFRNADLEPVEDPQQKDLPPELRQDSTTTCWLHLRQLEKEGSSTTALEDRIIVCETPVEVFNRLA
jgi:predicted Rossmann-fold nucleotide-binding protein